MVIISVYYGENGELYAYENERFLQSADSLRELKEDLKKLGGGEPYEVQYM